MLRVFSFIVLAVFVEHLVDQLKDPRLTLAVLLVGGVLLLRTLVRRSRLAARQAAAAESARSSSAPGKRARPATATVGVRPTGSGLAGQPAPVTHERRWR